MKNLKKNITDIMMKLNLILIEKNNLEEGKKTTLILQLKKLMKVIS